MPTDTNRPVVIITGGSSGIGKALMFQFLSKDYNVLITGRNKKALEKILTLFDQQEERISIFQADVTRKEDNEAMVQFALKKWNRIDILINNAGISMRAKFEEVDLSVIDHVMDINFRGAVYATKSCLPHIIKQKGSIVGVSSIAGYRGLPGRTGYSASKFALQGFLESLRTELLPSKVHVLIACPGFTESNIRKSALNKEGEIQAESPRDEKKMMTASHCAKEIFNATIKRKKHLILTNQGKLTVFLNKWLSGPIDKLVYNAMQKEENSGFPPL